MTRYAKKIVYEFIDADDEEEDNFVVITNDYWPSKPNYYETITNIDLDSYSTVSVQLHYHHKHNPHHIYKSKCRYITVKII